MLHYRLQAVVLLGLGLASTFGSGSLYADDTPPDSARRAPDRFQGLMEINPPAAPADNSLIAIEGATLLDGRGGQPIADSVVLIEGDRILAAGPREAIEIPQQAERVQAQGMTVMPGLLDAHLHVGSGQRLLDTTSLFLAHGVTSFRDPGRQYDIYEVLPQSTEPRPRCFATGPHFDQPPPAYPDNSVLLSSAGEARDTVNRFVEQGATVVKVYFRLPLDLIRATCETAHAHGIPVTAHLELIDADQAIAAGLDGIEHITSLGTCLAEPQAAEAFRQAVDAENDARREGRFALWADLDFSSPRVSPLLDVLVKRSVFICPTLAVFERRDGRPDVTLAQVRGFQNMMEFVGLCSQAGALLVTGSHTSSAYIPKGWAYQREMQLLVESGLSPMEVITASTWNNALFLGCHERLGSLEKGKLADLILVEGQPHEDIRAMYDIRRVMLGGNWISGTPSDPVPPAQRNVP